MARPQARNLLRFDPNKVYVLRTLKGLSQEALVREMGGVTLRAYQRWEAGKSQPYGSNIILLAEFFEVEPKDFFIITDPSVAA